MPKDIDAKIRHQIACAGLLGIKEGHGVARARTALKPQQIRHFSVSQLPGGVPDRPNAPAGHGRTLSMIRARKILKHFQYRMAKPLFSAKKMQRNFARTP
ncbi:hypothetical protein ACFQFS_03905 [Novosphingobium lubricantis]